jgi:hypothetical protein
LDVLLRLLNNVLFFENIKPCIQVVSSGKVYYLEGRITVLHLQNGKPCCWDPVSGMYIVHY